MTGKQMDMKVLSDVCRFTQNENENTNVRKDKLQLQMDNINRLVNSHQK